MKKIAKFALPAALALTLAACSQPPFATYTLDGGLVCTLRGNTTGIRRIEATAADGTVQTFRISDINIEPRADGGAELIDLNFDGHLDLSVQVRRYGNGDTRSRGYLWQDGRLVEAETLADLRSVSLDPDTQTLTAWERHHLEEEYEKDIRTTYVWHEGTLAPIARRELTHFIAEDEEIYQVTDYTAAPGEAFGEGEERWIFPDKFDASEIWN